MNLFPFLVALCAIYLAQCDTSISSDISVVITRNIDISTQIAKHIINVEAKNKGNDVTYLVHPLSTEEDKHLSYIFAVENGKKLQVSKTTIPSGTAGYVFYKIELASPLKKGASLKFTIEYVLTEALKAYPAEISQSESQYMLWEGSSNYISVYKIESDTTNVKVGSGKIISHTGNKSGDKIQFGPTKDIQPFTSKAASIHYENNSPFVVITFLQRTVEVSHWGNIAIEDHVEVLHKGAQLKGSFSRLDFQVDRRTKTPIVTTFKATLPAQAKDIYYRDQIGNISTSIVRGYDNRVEVEMRPRFPLLGGWRTNYILGYNVPSQEFLHSTGSEYALKIPLVHSLFNDMVIEKAQVKIILPETSHNIKIVKPYAINQLPDTLHFTYLDTIGRVVITLEKENLVDFHSQAFTIYYEFSYMSILREPIIAVVALLVVFVSFIILNRFDFSIARRETTFATHTKSD